MSEFVGSVDYMAPEIIKGWYDKGADIWAFGVCMFITLTGKSPFVGISEADTI